MEKIKYQNPKTRIYIDASNIILSAKEKGFDIKFISLKRYLEDKNKECVFLYFTPELNNEIFKKSILSIKEAGFNVIFKETFNYKNNFKANCDVEISHYITKDIKDGLTEKLILVSGDGDFSILLDFANKNKIKTFLYSFNKKSTAKILRKKKFLNVSYLIENNKVSIKMKDPHKHVAYEE